MDNQQNVSKMNIEGAINTIIKTSKCNTNLISDGYHTVGELYKHRIILYIKLCEMIAFPNIRLNLTWRSLRHSDGSLWDGWFLLGIQKDAGKQITYHLPIEYWDKCDFAETLDKAPEFDGHTSDDVLKRIEEL